MLRQGKKCQKEKNDICMFKYHEKCKEKMSTRIGGNVERFSFQFPWEKCNPLKFDIFFLQFFPWTFKKKKKFLFLFR